MAHRKGPDVRPAIHEKVMLYIDGDVKRLEDWAEVSPVSLETIMSRLNDRWSVKMAVETVEVEDGTVERARAGRYIELIERELAVWAIRAAVARLFPDAGIMEAEPGDILRRMNKAGKTNRLVPVVSRHMAVQQAALKSVGGWFGVCSDYNGGVFYNIVCDYENGDVRDISNISGCLGLFMVNNERKQWAEETLGNYYLKHKPFRLIEYDCWKIVEVGEKVLKRDPLKRAPWGPINL